jgi:hypothetical protein
MRACETACLIGNITCLSAGSLSDRSPLVFLWCSGVLCVCVLGPASGWHSALRVVPTRYSFRLRNPSGLFMAFDDPLITPIISEYTDAGSRPSFKLLLNFGQYSNWKTLRSGNKPLLGVIIDLVLLKVNDIVTTNWHLISSFLLLVLKQVAFKQRAQLQK